MEHFLVKAAVDPCFWEHYVPNGVTYFPDLDLASESLREQVYTVLTVTESTAERLSALEQHWEAVQRVGGIYVNTYLGTGEVRFWSNRPATQDDLPF